MIGHHVTNRCKNVMRLNSITNFFDRNSLICLKIFVVVILLLYLSPYVLLGENNHWLIWDNLDSNFVWLDLIANHETLFGSNTEIISQPLGGVPRGVFSSEFEILVWLFKIFGANWGYVINRIIITAVAFSGMYLLLRRHVIAQDDGFISIGVALCFSTLPFWPSAGLAIAGLPLILYCILDVRVGRKFSPVWVFVIIYPFYSSLVFSGLFFLIAVSILAAYDVWVLKKIPPWIYVIFVIASLYALVNYRLIIDFLIGSEFVSHRASWPLGEPKSLRQGAGKMMQIFAHGHPHANSMHRELILPLALLSSLLMMRDDFGSQVRKWFFLSLTSAVLIALWFGFLKVEPFIHFDNLVSDLIPGLNISRFYVLSPALWMVVFGTVLFVLIQKSSTFRSVAFVAILLQVGLNLRAHESVVAYDEPTVGEFFAREQFAEIKRHIDEPVESYRVGSVGIHPSISIYNGFYTVDGYLASYPIEYKDAFKKIIQFELEKDPNLLRYYENWGSRAYLFSANIGKDINKIGQARSRNPDLFRRANLNYDWTEFWKIGGRFLLSAVPLDVSGQPNLRFEKLFRDNESAWDIYLYKVIP